MDKEIISALIGAGGALIGSIIGASLTYIFTIKQFRKEQQEILRRDHLARISEASRKFAALLKPISENAAPEERIIIQEDGHSYLNAPAAKQLFKSITDFVFSEYGSSLTKEMRQRVIPDTRDFIMDILETGKADEKGRVAVTQTQAKKAQTGLNWMRHHGLKDGGLSEE